MKKYQLKPEEPIVFEAIQYKENDTILEAISEKCKKINDVGIHYVNFFIKKDTLFFYKQERYGIGMTFESPIKLMSYLVFKEDDALFFEEKKFEEEFIETT